MTWVWPAKKTTTSRAPSESIAPPSNRNPAELTGNVTDAGSSTVPLPGSTRATRSTRTTPRAGEPDQQVMEMGTAKGRTDEVGSAEDGSGN